MFPRPDAARIRPCHRGNGESPQDIGLLTRLLERFRIQKHPDVEIQIEGTFCVVTLPAICPELGMTRDICLGVGTAACSRTVQKGAADCLHFFHVITSCNRTVAVTETGLSGTDGKTAQASCSPVFDHRDGPAQFLQGIGFGNRPTETIRTERCHDRVVMVPA